MVPTTFCGKVIKPQSQYCIRTGKEEQQHWHKKIICRSIQLIKYRTYNKIDHASMTLLKQSTNKIFELKSKT